MNDLVNKTSDLIVESIRQERLDVLNKFYIIKAHIEHINNINECLISKTDMNTYNKTDMAIAISVAIKEEKIETLNNLRLIKSNLPHTAKNTLAIGIINQLIMNYEKWCIQHL